MKTIELLERLNAMKELVSYHVDAARTLNELIADVEADFRQESAAAKGNGAAHRIITKLLKTVKDDNRYSLAYAWIDSENRQCVCDGFRAFRFKDHLPLEERPKDCGKPIDMDAIYPNSDDFATKYLQIKLPSAADIKIEIAKQKSEGKKRDYYYHFGADLPVVNAQYLLDLVTVLPDADTIWYSTLISPMYVFTDRADATLLPVRMQQNYGAEKTLAAQELHSILRQYRENVHKDSEHSMSLERLAYIAKLQAKISA